MLAVFGVLFTGLVAVGLVSEDTRRNQNDEQCVQQEVRKRECYSFVERGTVVDVCADRTDHIKVTCGTGDERRYFISEHVQEID